MKVNIAIMRAFVKLRETLETNRELARKFAELEERVGKHDDEISGDHRSDPATDGSAGKTRARLDFMFAKRRRVIGTREASMIAWTIYITFAGAFGLLFMPRFFARWIALATALAGFADELSWRSSMHAIRNFRDDRARSMGSRAGNGIPPRRRWHQSHAGVW